MIRTILCLSAGLMLVACQETSTTSGPGESDALGQSLYETGGEAWNAPLSGPDDGGDLDQAMADLPPIRTGPLATSDSGPWDDELAAERRAQLDLPRADDPLWDVLRRTRIDIDERTQLFTAAHPAPVRAMAGRRVTVRGYMLPLEATNRTRHFLISPYTPVCFFHPPAEPNEVIEVRLSRPIDAGYHLVEVTGVLQLADDGEKGLFFAIPNGTARVIERISG